MKEEDRKKIEELMAGMQCPRNFACAENGFERLCEAVDLGLESYIQCLAKKPSACTFALSFGNNYFCRCPLRVYLRTKLKQ